MSKPRSAEDKLMDVFGKMIDSFVQSHTSKEVDALERKIGQLVRKVEQRARKRGGQSER